MELPNLSQIPFNSDLRDKVVLRYRDLLGHLFNVPLWPTYYNHQLMVWINETYPQFANEKPDFSASAVVTYLLKTYETSSSGKFLFRETRRDALILALKNHRPTNYLLTYIATELEKLPPQEECKSTLLEDVASLVTKCLYDQECRRIVETEIIVDRLPENIKDQFNKFFLAELETLYAQEEEKRDGIEDQIRKLEFKFWKYNKKIGVESYLKAVALPLAFLNPNRQLASLRGSASRCVSDNGPTLVGDSKSLSDCVTANGVSADHHDFTDRIKGGDFPVENLFSLSELVVTFPRGLQDEVHAALQDEVQILLGQTIVPQEQGWENPLHLDTSFGCRPRRGRTCPRAKARPPPAPTKLRLFESPLGGSLSPPAPDPERSDPAGVASLRGLETLCRTLDLKHVVLYYGQRPTAESGTGKEFVFFREDEVFEDIANHNTQKYPDDFLDKMKKRVEVSPS